MPYGITEAGRQWQKVIEEWLLNDAGFERIYGVSQLFVERDRSGTITMLVSKVTDDILMGGSTQHMEVFAARIKKRFEISKVIVDGIIHFNGCILTQGSAGGIEMSMETYMEAIPSIPVPTARRKQHDEKATKSEVAQYRSLAGAMIWAGSGALPQAAYVGSEMQQRIPSLKVHDLCEANGMLKEMRDLKPIVAFPKPNKEIKTATITSFSDAAFNISKKNQYGQTGILTGL